MSTWNGDSQASPEFAKELSKALERAPELKNVSWHQDNVDRVIGASHCFLQADEITAEQFVMAAKQLFAEGSLE